ELANDARAHLEGPVELTLHWHDFLGDPPSADELLRQAPSARVDIDLGAAGWYLNVPGDRLAVVASLRIAAAGSTGRVLVASNVTLTPPARPAPPGPLWMATLPPSLDRRKLL